MLVAAGCDAPPPEYGARSMLLRLIPEQATISTAGGSVFVLSEFDSGTINPHKTGVLTAFRVDDARVDALPGAPRCPVPTFVQSPENQSDSSDSGTVAGATAGASLALPFSAFLTEESRNVYESGLTLEVPPGSDDVLLVAAAYEHSAGAAACPRHVLKLVAMATVRITRTKADGEEPDGGQVSSSGADGTDSGAELSNDTSADGETRSTNMSNAADGGATILDSGALFSGEARNMTSQVLDAADLVTDGDGSVPKDGGG